MELAGIVVGIGAAIFVFGGRGLIGLVRTTSERRQTRASAASQEPVVGEPAGAAPRAQGQAVVPGCALHEDSRQSQPGLFNICEARR